MKEKDHYLKIQNQKANKTNKKQRKEHQGLWEYQGQSKNGITESWKDGETEKLSEEIRTKEFPDLTKTKPTYSKDSVNKKQGKHKEITPSHIINNQIPEI